MAVTRLSDPTPRMTLPRALLSEALRLARSPLAGVHLVCGLAAGLACGEYFSVTRWDPALGADAYAQFLGALLTAHVRHRLQARRGRARCRAPRQPHGGPSRGRASSRRKLLALAALARARWPWRSACSGPCSPSPGACRSGPLRLRPPGRASCWAACPSTRQGSAWPCASTQRRHRRGAAGCYPRVLLSGRTCARPRDRRAHRCPGDALSWVPLAWLTRAWGRSGWRPSSTPHARRAPPHDRARWPHVLTPATAAVPIAWFCRFEDGGQMRRKPLAAVLALLSAALVLGRMPCADAG